MGVYLAIAGTEVELADRVVETTQTTGTGTYSLDGVSATGRQSFVGGVGSGNATIYVTELDSAWEIGVGTVTAGAPDTLTRDFIIASSNGGSAVSWLPGVKTIFIDTVAALLAQIEAPGQVLWGGTATGTNALSISVDARVTSLRDGMLLLFRNTAAANTGNMTLDVNLIGAKSLMKAVGTQIPAGEAAADAVLAAVYLSAIDDFIVLAGLARLGGTKGETRVYTSNNTWTKPAGLSFVEVELVGGGGSGAGAGAASHAGGGGGGGQYAWARIAASSIGATVAVTIGTGGAAPSAGNNAGNNGNTTTFGTLVDVAGGSGAPAFTSGTSAGGAGGTGGGIDAGAGYLIAGSPGTNGTPQTEVRPATGGGGRGGGPLGGGGGRGGSALSNAAGFAGQLYGGGGGGAGYGTAAGGAGADGIVIVREYFA